MCFKSLFGLGAQLKKNEHAVLESESSGLVGSVGVVGSFDVSKEQSSVVDSVLVFGW